MSHKVHIFRRFVRFWHWAQVALIIGLLATGFEVHGAYQWLGFERAVDYHTIAAWSLIGLWVVGLFWYVGTGAWPQYASTPHLKHNPLRRLTYLLILVVIVPVIGISGLLYIFHDQWTAWGVQSFVTLEWVALFHTAGAFVMLAWLILYLYLSTAGPGMGASESNDRQAA